MSLNVPTPLDLLASLQSSNPPPERRNQFYRLYTPLIYAWACQRGLQPADAEDLTQIVLLKAEEALPKYRRESGKPFRSWLRAIVYNEAINFWRRRVRRKEVGADALGELPDAGPDLFTEREEYIRELLHQALQVIQSSIEPKSFRAFLMMHVEQKPVAEMAQELGLSPQAIYQINYRVRRKLQELFAALYEE